jgi:hypothetical protein
MKKGLFIFLIFLLTAKIIFGLGDTFNVAVQLGMDSDGDGIQDVFDPDDDNDGILDGDDCLTGNSSFVNSNTLTVNVTVNNETNLAQEFNETISVKIMDISSLEVDFQHNCSIGRLNLANITVNKQTGVSEGFILVKGINLLDNGTTKIVYVDDLNETNTLCIKDQEIDSISDISSNCDGDGEVSITCNGTSGSYVCSDLGSRYKITGLQNSGVKEYTYVASPGGPSGGGGGGRVVPEEEIPEDKPDFEVDPNFIKVKIKPGESRSEVIEIRNIGEIVLDMDLDVGLISKYLSLSEESFLLEPGDSKKINLDISVGDEEVPDAYIGRIIVHGGGITKIVNVIIEIKEKSPLFDIQTQVVKTAIRPMADVRAKIHISKTGDVGPIDLLLYYAIKDIRGKVLVSEQETITIDKETTITKSLSMPEDYSCTDYVFYAKATYNDKSASSADVFSIICKEGLLAGMAEFGYGKSGSLMFFLVVFVVGMLIVVLSNAKKYNELKGFVNAKYYGEIGEKEAAADSFFRKQIRDFEILMSRLENKIKNHKFLEAKGLYNKLSRLYVDLNEKSVSKEKKIGMYAALTKGFGKFMEERKRQPEITKTDMGFKKENQNFEDQMKKLEENLKNHEFQTAKKNYNKLSEIYVDLNDKSISKDKKIKMYHALSKEFGKFMEERKKELQKYEKKVQNISKGDAEHKVEKKFKDIVDKLEENLKNRELLKAKHTYSKLNKVYCDLNEQPIADERKVRMYAILMREHDKLMKERKKT